MKKRGILCLNEMEKHLPRPTFFVLRNWSIPEFRPGLSCFLPFHLRNAANFRALFSHPVEFTIINLHVKPRYVGRLLDRWYL